MLGLPVVIIVSCILTIIAPIICVVASVKGRGWAPACQSTGGTVVGKGNHALGLGEAKGVRVRTIFVRVVASLAIMTVFTCRAVPDGMGRMKLSAKATTVGKRKRASGAAGWHLIVVVLRHGKPPEAMVARVFYSSS